MNSFDYANTARLKGFSPLVMFEQKLLGVFITATDGPIKSLQDLRGQKVAMAPANAAYTLLAKQALLSQGINPYTDLQLVYARTHQSAIQKLILGEVAATATMLSMVSVTNNHLRRQVRPFFYTEPVVSLLIATAPTIVEGERQLLLSLLTDADNVAVSLFHEQFGYGLGGFIPATDKDLSPIVGIWQDLVAEGEGCCRQDTELH